MTLYKHAGEPLNRARHAKNSDFIVSKVRGLVFDAREMVLLY